MRNDELAVLSDAELVRRAVAGESRALAILLARHRPVIVRHLQRYPIPAAERSDALQDALLLVVRKLHTFRGDAQFSTWLYRVTANAVLMRMRAERRRRTQSLTDEDRLDDSTPNFSGRGAWSERADVRMEQVERERAVTDALTALPEHYRELVVEHYLDGRPLESIATAHTTTESAVRSRLHRARKELRRRLGVAEPAAEDAA